MDDVAGLLRELQDEGVVVLWRPYHEMNGGWFWWGGKTRDSFTKLWTNLYERLTHHHSLSNLLWVYSANAEFDAATGDGVLAEYPGSAYVDVVGMDVYVDIEGKSGAAPIRQLPLDQGIRSTGRPRQALRVHGSRAKGAGQRVLRKGPLGADVFSGASRPIFPGPSSG